MALPPGVKPAAAGEGAPRSRRLREMPAFGDNPGDLRMLVFEPSKRPRRCPAVLVLHGCSQDAEGFDRGSGWSDLAEANGFVLIYAEQKPSNNGQGCFSWFRSDDTRRGGGEVESLRQMVDWAVDSLLLDASTIFVTGLSAGGAMACAFLATYPELCAGGAIIAGLPYGAASNASQAFDAMLMGRPRDASRWGHLVRDASGHQGPWPKIAIWYGTADRVVATINAGELVKQWTNVHGVAADSPLIDHVGPATRRIWRDSNGCECVTDYMVAGLGHGMPVDDANPPAPFFLPTGISAAEQIALDFGLLSRRKPNRILSLFGLDA